MLRLWPCKVRGSGRTFSNRSASVWPTYFPVWFYAGGAARGNCHYRHLGGTLAAGDSIGTRSGPPNAVYEQSQEHRTCGAKSCRCSQGVSDRRKELRAGLRDTGAGAELGKWPTARTRSARAQLGVPDPPLHRGSQRTTDDDAAAIAASRNLDLRLPIAPPPAHRLECDF